MLAFFQLLFRKVKALVTIKPQLKQKPLSDEIINQALGITNSFGDVVEHNIKEASNITDVIIAQQPKMDDVAVKILELPPIGRR